MLILERIKMIKLQGTKFAIEKKQTQCVRFNKATSGSPISEIKD